MHHLSCHTSEASEIVSLVETPSRESGCKEDNAEEKRLPDVNMNNMSKIACPEPGCHFETEYRANLARHKKRKHMAINGREEDLVGHDLMQVSPAGENRKRSHSGLVSQSVSDARSSKMMKLQIGEVKSLAVKEEEEVVEGTTAGEMEGRYRGNLKWDLGVVSCPNCAVKLR